MLRAQVSATSIYFESFPYEVDGTTGLVLLLVIIIILIHHHHHHVGGLRQAPSQRQGVQPQDPHLRRIGLPSRVC
jgi:hypothetical protein